MSSCVDSRHRFQHVVPARHVEVSVSLKPCSDSGGTTSDASGSAVQTLRVATLNVLADCFPWAVELMICSEDRRRLGSCGVG